MIVIAGLPSSGNKLLLEHIKRGVQAHGCREFVQVWHGDNESPNLTRPVGERLVLVIPVRAESIRLRSVERRMAEAPGQFMPTDVTTMRRNVLAMAGLEGVATRLVSYEGLVADPEAEGRDLFQWLGFPWVPWPTGDSANPSQPQHGRVFDANEKYRVGSGGGSATPSS